MYVFHLVMWISGCADQDIGQRLDLVEGESTGLTIQNTNYVYNMENGEWCLHIFRKMVTQSLYKQ